MPTVNTVLGPVETADLGFTLSHEHVGTNAAGLRHTYPDSSTVPACWSKRWQPCTRRTRQACGRWSR